MPGNQVVLTFAGEDKQLTDSFDRVGGASKKMGDDVGSSAKKLDEHANGLGKVGESSDNAERNLIGVHDVIDGTATIMKGPGKQGIVAYVQGWADLAGGIAPMAEYLSKTKVATLASAAAQKVAAAGTVVWTGAQKLLNLAFVASPIGWIVLGIGLLVTAVVLIATKTTWFQSIWKVTWAWVKTAALDAWNFIKQIPGWIGSAFSRVASFISAPFRAAFNYISDAWNNTIGRLSWSVPGWVPFIGGDSISVPNLPHFHSGGTVPGTPGSEMLAVLQAGETVSPVSSGNSDMVHVVVQLDSGVLLETTAKAVRRRGGSPAVLNIKVA